MMKLCLMLMMFRGAADLQFLLQASKPLSRTVLEKIVSAHQPSALSSVPAAQGGSAMFGCLEKWWNTNVERAEALEAERKIVDLADGIDASSSWWELYCCCWYSFHLCSDMKTRSAHVLSQLDESSNATSSESHSA